MSFRSLRISAAGLALAVGLTGAAQAEPFNIFSASKAREASSHASLEQVHYRGGGRRYRHHRGFHPGAAVALGTFGLIAGAAAASHYGRPYYCDPYYEYCGPRRRVYRFYEEPRYYAPPPYRYYGY